MAFLTLQAENVEFCACNGANTSRDAPRAMLHAHSPATRFQSCVFKRPGTCVVPVQIGTRVAAPADLDGRSRWLSGPEFRHLLEVPDLSALLPRRRRWQARHVDGGVCITMSFGFGCRSCRLPSGAAVNAAAAAASFSEECV